MKSAPKPLNAETRALLGTLVERAKALDTIFAVGGEVEVPAPITLRGPKGKKLEVVETVAHRKTNIDRKLRAWCVPASFGDGAETRMDASVRDGRQLYAREGALAVEGFDDALREILAQIRVALCPRDASAPTAELLSLNLYGRGGHFVAHKDTPRDPSVFATLVVCLPLRFSGGRLVVEHGSRATFDWETTWYASFSNEKEGKRIRWAAFFGDVDHRVEMVHSGCRATLTYELRRTAGAASSQASPPGDAEDAFTAALAAALADPQFIPHGGKLGVPCLHLYTIPTDATAHSSVEGLLDRLKGRDRLVADALKRAGLTPRVVPYVYETCGGDSWRLHRETSARERHMFTQARLKGSILEDKLPVEFHANFDHEDDVTWLVRPPWISSYREPSDGRPEPEVALLGEPEYSATDYFGNEASHSAFYSAAAILFDVPPKAARPRALRP